MNKEVKIQKPKYINEQESIEDYYEDIFLSDKIKDNIVDNLEIVEKEDKGILIDSWYLETQDLLIAI